MKTFKIWLFAAAIFLVICLFLHSILLCVSIVEKIQDRRLTRGPVEISWEFEHVFTEEDEKQWMEEAIASWEFEHTITGEYEIISPFYRMETYIRQMTPELRIWGGFFLVEYNGFMYSVHIRLDKDGGKEIEIVNEGEYYGNT